MANSELDQVLELLEELYNMVSEAWGVPLGNDKCIVEREKTLEMISKIRDSLPDELSEAKRLVVAKAEFIGNAKREAESIRKSSEERARILIDEQEIVRVAQKQSAELIANAEFKSKELRRVANEYVEDILRRTEETVAEALKAINTSRSSFINLAGTAADEPQTEEAAETEETAE